MENSNTVTRAMFVQSLQGNIKEKYFFEKKLGSGGYGAVYLARNKSTGKFICKFLRFRQARKLQSRLCKSLEFLITNLSKTKSTSSGRWTTPTSSSCSKPGRQNESASWSPSKCHFESHFFSEFARVENCSTILQKASTFPKNKPRV